MPLARLLGALALLTTTTDRAGGKIDQKLGQSVQGVGRVVLFEDVTLDIEALTEESAGT